MTYKEYYDAIRADCILIDETTDKWFVKPDCRYYINGLDTSLKDVTDFKDATIDTVVEQLKFEVELHNNLFDDTKMVMKSFKEFIDMLVEPEMVKEENKIAEEFMAYLKDKSDNKVAEEKPKRKRKPKAEQTKAIDGEIKENTEA